MRDPDCLRADYDAIETKIASGDGKLLLLAEDGAYGTQTYRTREEGKADVFDYIERFYNTKRRHSTIGYLSPMDFEMKAGLA